MKRKNIFTILIITLSVIFIAGSCAYERSSITGWDYNNPRNGGFQKTPYPEQETGPGLILIEGGTFTMGRVEQDITLQNHNIPIGSAMVRTIAEFTKLSIAVFPIFLILECFFSTVWITSLIFKNIQTYYVQ